MLTRKRIPSPTWTAFVAVGLSMGCSLRDLDYLQAGETSDSTEGDSLGPGFPTTGISTSGSGTSTSQTGTDTTQGELSAEEDSGGESSVGVVDSSGGSSSGSGTSESDSTTAAEDDESSDATSSTGGTGSSQDTGEDSSSSSSSTGVEPVDGNYIVNGSFEQGYLGWLFDPPSMQGEFVFVQWPPAGSTNPDGQNELSTWADDGDNAVYAYQRLVGIPDGFYTFTGNFNRGGEHNATQMFARDCGGEDIVIDIPLTAPTEWIEVSIPAIEVIGGACEVGFFVDSPASAWLNSDLFSFVADPE